jgi:hypothetical protein
VSKSTVSLKEKSLDTVVWEGTSVPLPHTDCVTVSNFVDTVLDTVGHSWTQSCG